MNVDEDIEDNNNKKDEKEGFVPTDNTPRAPTGESFHNFPSVSFNTKILVKCIAAFVIRKLPCFVSLWPVGHREGLNNTFLDFSAKRRGFLATLVALHLTPVSR